MDTPKLPPFSSLLKSREVEDPVNLWLHRPLAYAFVAAVFRTPMTPNMVTVLAMIVGVGAGACFLHGGASLMVLGGALLWASSILDGADGILARAKKMQSEFGRALDGAADSVVAVVTVFPAFFHVYATTHQVLYVYLAVPAILFTLPHLYFYDFYKESYLRMTRPERGGEGQDVANVEAHLAEKKAKGEASSLVNFIITQMMLPMLRSEVAWVGMTNPDALGELRTSKPTAERAEIFRKHNRLPMRFWMAVSLCPHSYIMAICAMFDRLDLYLWIRLVAMNVIFVIGLFVQRRASRATLREWAATDGAGGSAAVGATA